MLALGQDLYGGDELSDLFLISLWIPRCDEDEGRRGEEADEKRWKKMDHDECELRNENAEGPVQ